MYSLLITLLIVILYFGQTLFIPLSYGLFIAIILYPVCNWLEKHHLSKSASVAISLLLVFILFSLLLWMVIFQFNTFNNDLPELKKRIGPSIEELQKWITLNMDVSSDVQNQWKENFVARIADNSAGLLTGSLSRMTSGLFMLFIIPVFAALFLYNRKDFVLFLEKSAGDKYNGRLHLILHNTIHTYFHFIKGMTLVYIIVGLLNSIGLLALGIEHAILFGFLTAVMTIIPYIGIFISALLPITVAWITKDSIWYPLGVVGVFVFVQYLEANVIFPKVVASQLNVSTWAMLVAIIAGGIIWGVSGMILFIPLVGILKMISDSIPAWEPLNILLRRSKT